MAQMLTLNFPDGRKRVIEFHDRLAAESDAAHWRKHNPEVSVELAWVPNCPFCGSGNRPNHYCN